MKEDRPAAETSTSLTSAQPVLLKNSLVQNDGNTEIPKFSNSVIRNNRKSQIDRTYAEVREERLAIWEGRAELSPERKEQRKKYTAVQWYLIEHTVRASPRAKVELTGRSRFLGDVIILILFSNNVTNASALYAYVNNIYSLLCRHVEEAAQSKADEEGITVTAYLRKNHQAFAQSRNTKLTTTEIQAILYLMFGIFLEARRETARLDDTRKYMRWKLNKAGREVAHVLVEGKYAWARDELKREIARMDAERKAAQRKRRDERLSKSSAKAVRS